MYVKQNGCAKPDVVIYISGEKQQKLSHENPNSLRVEKEISAVSAVAYSSFQSMKHTRVLHLPLNVISFSLSLPPSPHPFTLEQLVKFLQ